VTRRLGSRGEKKKKPQQTERGGRSEALTEGVIRFELTGKKKKSADLRAATGALKRGPGGTDREMNGLAVPVLVEDEEEWSCRRCWVGMCCVHRGG